MKKLFLSLSLLLIGASAFAYTHQFQTVEGDPLNTLEYTLPNGLKVFMSVNKDQPRIQTYIAVRVGGKNDPAETTGLAHYFEHLMFKGTEKFGTSDYAAEKPMLDRIEALFEEYRHTTDSIERRRIYKEIDSISYEASKIAIPNEYDKLMAAIGADGTNAYTSQDMTVYVEDIPSNQIENWAMIEADRFENPVLRGFHTELETIYEEKNMSLTKDNRKVFERMLATLYPSHPYGTQTVLGTQENLKNPSITNVKAYHKQWYVPNNMAICLSGDFDPDNMVEIIEKYFGHLKPNPNLVRPALPSEKPFTAPVAVEVVGPDAENVTLAWRVPAAADDDMLGLQILDNILANGKTGLVDLDINMPQRVLGASAGIYGLSDAGAYIMSGRPKGDQTLDDVKDILLAEIVKLRNGEFSEELLDAVKANIKLELQKQLTDNSSRADMYVDAFINGIPWAEHVAELSRMDKISKEDLVALANKYFGTDNYAVIYKRQGVDPNELKLAKPELTPIEMNRDKASDFLIAVQASEVEPIEPKFIDFDTDLTKYNIKNGAELLYVPNNTNDVFRLLYVYDTGSYTDKLLPYASEMLKFMGTDKLTPEEVQNEFYKLACSFFFSIGAERSYAVVTGLSENMDKAVRLFEDVIAHAKLSPEALAAYADRVEKSRADSKLNQAQNFSRLSTYIVAGPKNSATDIIPVDEIRAMNPDKIADALRCLNNYEQTIIYWGNQPAKNVVKLVEKTHSFAKNPIAASKEMKYPYLHPEETTIFVAPYEAKQLYMRGYSNRGDKYDPEFEPMRTIYNMYFGGSMSGIVFQEMRESRSLAYSAGAGMYDPSKKDRDYTYQTFIATQNDKLIDALSAFDEIINDMPQSEAAFELAKQGLEAQIRTNRCINDDIAFYYLEAKDMGTDHDLQKDVFELLPKVTMEDLVKFQKEHVAGRTYYYGILAKPENIDMEALSKLGKVVVLTQEDIFGY